MDLQAFTPNEDITNQIGELVCSTLPLIGEDPNREGLVKTPQRVGRAMQFLTKGYHEDPVAILQSAIFNED